jgi:iron complex outermembrane receptor protein
LDSDPGSKLIWQFGALYYNNNLSNADKNVAYPTPFLLFNSVTLEKATRAFGVFGEATYPLADSWRLTEGVRYDHTNVAVNQDYTSITGVTQSLGGEAGIRRFSNVTYKVRLEHDVTARNLLYASVTTGVSPGDISAATGITGNPIVLELKAETLTSYEIGSKNRFLDDTLQVNGAIYYSNYGGYQTAGVNITPNNVLNPTFATIASAVQVYGTEWEALYDLTRHDRVGVNAGYANSYYVDKNGVVIATDPVTQSPETFSRFFAKDKIPGVAPYTGDVFYDHTVPLPGGSTLTLHGDARWHSPYDGSAITSKQLGSYGLIRVESAWLGDLNATWRSDGGRYSVTGYVRNVGDKRDKLLGPGLNGEAPGSISSQVTFSDPRTFGVVLSARL